MLRAWKVGSKILFGMKLNDSTQIVRWYKECSRKSHGADKITEEMELVRLYVYKLKGHWLTMFDEVTQPSAGKPPPIPRAELGCVLVVQPWLVCADYMMWMVDWVFFVCCVVDDVGDGFGVWFWLVCVCRRWQREGKHNPLLHLILSSLVLLSTNNNLPSLLDIPNTTRLGW